MEDNHKELYSSSVVDFVTVAGQYCKHLEVSEGYERKEFLLTMQKLLTLVYLKAINMPSFEPFFDELNERFVTEDDWNQIDRVVSRHMGDMNSFEEPFDEALFETGEVSVGSVSEYMADIYQDMKDFILQYQTGTAEVMNDALWECMLNFETTWGKKLLSILKALHRVLYLETAIDSDSSMIHPSEERHTHSKEIDTSSWIISKRQREYRDDE